MEAARRRSWLAWVLGGSLLVGLIVLLYQNAHRYATLFQFSAGPVLIIAVLTLAGLFLNGIINTLLLRALDKVLPVGDGFLMASMASLANQLPVSGGIVARGVYLRNRHQLSYAKFLSATLALFVCFVSANGIVGLGVLTYWTLSMGRTGHAALFIVFGVMTLAILVLALPLRRFKLPASMQHSLLEASNGWDLVRRRPLLLAGIVGLQMVVLLTLAWRYWLAFRMLSQSISVGESVLFSAVALLTQLVSLAPGGLGVTEAIVGGIASLLGFELTTSVAAVTLDRLISTVVIVVVGSLSSLLITRQMVTPTEGRESLP